ncbi:MAG: class I SAM-dependent methyltransferase [Candidatus Roizmanbacteria bacterium]
MNNSKALLNLYTIPYLRERPLFFSFIRPQEAYLFRKNKEYIKGPVLDFGCGDGFFAKVAFQNKLDVGLDVLNSRILEAYKNNIYDEVRMYDGTTIPFKNNSFQSVVSNCVMEHLPDLNGNLKEIHRILKPGGYLITSVMTNKWNEYMSDKKFIGKSYANWFRMNQVHLNLLSEEEWSQSFKNAGFKIASITGYLSKRTTQYLELSHYISTPSLISHKLLNRWVLFPRLAELLGLPKFIVDKLDIDVEPQDSSALFYVLKK